MTIDRLTPLDRLMLGASRRWPQDIGALAILDGATLFDASGRLRMEAIRHAIEARLHLVPRFRQLIHTPRRGFGGPFWVDAPDFDLTSHVREHPLPPSGDESGLLEVVEQLRRRPLDPTRRLWEMWFLTGLPDQKVGLYVRIHHSIADGMAAMATVAAFLDTAPDQSVTPPAPWTPGPRPSTKDLLTDNLAHYLHSVTRAVSVIMRPRAAFRRLREAWPAMRELLTERPASKTALDRMVGPARQVRLIRTSLEAVKRAGRAHGATVNDVLLTVTGGGVRALLASRGEPVGDTTIRAYSPVSLRRQLDDPQQGNLISQMAVPLRLGDADPTRRLRQVAAETTRRKAMKRTSLGVLVQNRILRRLTLMAAMRQRVNVATASIPGPPIPLYLAGARMLEVFPLIPLIADEPLGIGALSYAGDLFIGIVADPDVCPDIDVLAAGIRNELEELQSVYHSSPNRMVTSKERITR
ncbi:MAG TPA: wax ester/triacylglycerol synthase family O-acyltransferase [Acidimicrobiia bacterium]